MHYTSDQLRDDQFGLLDASQTAEIAAHLETCADCRAALEHIQQQFAALDILNDPPAVSEEMIARVVNATPSSRSPRKTVPFRAATLLAAAASVAIMFSLFGRDGSPNRPNRKVADSGGALGEHALPDRTAGVPPAKSERTARRAVPTLAELHAEKPFAPASNIELNVLPRRDDVQLTIYNAEDLTLVRETRKLTLKRGWNWLQFMWSNTLIDPTSLSLEPKTHADQIEITQLVYPPRLNELARWTIFSEFDGEAEFELTYFTSGLQWKAFYEATLSPDEQSMQLRSFVRIDNGSGEDYENAQTRLVVGEVNLVDRIADLANRRAFSSAPRSGANAFDCVTSGILSDMKGDKIENDLFSNWSMLADDEFVLDQKEIVKQALSEYQLYTIEGRETIPDGWGKRLPSFDVQEIGITNLYKYDEERWNNSTMRFLSFANTEACQLGETPLPEGTVRIFGRDGSPSRPQSALGQHALPLSYIGASDIKYIPIGEEVELELGATQKVKVEPVLMQTRTENYEFYQTDNPPEDDEMDDLFGGPHWYKGDISGWDEITNWKIEITNTRDLPVEVEITRSTGSNEWTLQTDAPYEKQDARHIRFTIRLEPYSKQEINYELTLKQ